MGVSLALLVLGGTGVAFGQKDVAERNAAPGAGLPSVRAAMLRSVERGHVPGAVAYVVRDGRVVMHEAVGDAAPGRPMTPDAIFRIASMSKAVTSVGVMILVDEGKVALDDPVTKFVPEFAATEVLDAKTGMRSPLARPITVRDLLTQTSGIVYGFGADEPFRAASTAAEVADGLSPADPTLAENVRRVAKVPLAHQPGAAWTYGMNTDVLGRVIEVASGLPLDRFLAGRIFEPLGMADTGFFVPAEKLPRLVTVYQPGPEEHPRVVPVDADPQVVGTVTFSPGRVAAPPTYLSGGAGLVSTAADYGRFLAMLLGGGEAGGVRVLRADTVRQMTTHQIGDLACEYTIHGARFGLGFGITAPRGDGPEQESVAPAGSYSWGGFYHTLFWVDPETRVVAVLMTQIQPWGQSKLWPEFQRAVYADPTP